MNLTKLIAFTATLILVAAVSAALGSVLEPSPPGGGDETGHGATMAAEQMPTEHAGGGEHGGSGMAMPAMVAGADGTSSSLGGLTLAPRGGTLAAGRTVLWRFRVLGPDGRPLRRFTREQDKLLHLILVRSDLSGYQHLHPRLRPDGEFVVPIEVARSGRYRAIVDFTTVGGQRYVLGTDLVAPGAGAGAVRPLPAPAAVAASHGYTVRLRGPAELRAGDEARLTFEIARSGEPVRDLQPYLGAYGHLVALQASDLAYSHVHPVGEDLAAGEIAFDAELAGPGDYRLFVQFRAGGRVHTAAFSRRVETAGGHVKEAGHGH
jgi:hypothetical protein